MVRRGGHQHCPGCAPAVPHRPGKGYRERLWRPGLAARAGAIRSVFSAFKAMATASLRCPIRQVIVHVYPGTSKTAGEARLTLHFGRRARPLLKPRFLPMLKAQAVARQLQALQIGTVSVL